MALRKHPGEQLGEVDAFPAEVTGLDLGAAGKAVREYGSACPAFLIAGNSPCSAAAGENNAAIGVQLDVHVDTIRKWRRRFATARLAGLKDAARSRS